MTLPSQHEMERAYRRSDASYDGVFYLAVRTTGVFCRPSCGARKPRATNVLYFATPREALFAGFRPCKRCTPMAAAGTLPEWVVRLLREVDRNPEERLTDARIRVLGIDPVRARRYFQKNYGMTFQAYCRSRRLGKALKHIRTGAPLDDVMLGSGYESYSGFRAAFGKEFGGSPGRLRSLEPLTVTWIESPLGSLIAAATETHLVLLEFTERRMLEAQFTTLRKYYGRPIVPGENSVLALLRKELAEYFTGDRKLFTVPLEFPGTPFQKQVWAELRKLHYGRSISYEELARRIGVPGAQRAVGHSNGLNRIAILVPCHRVIAKNGGLGGYGGGVWRKQALLDLERGVRRWTDPSTGEGRAPSAGTTLS